LRFRSYLCLTKLIRETELHLVARTLATAAIEQAFNYAWRGILAGVAIIPTLLLKFRGYGGVHQPPERQVPGLPRVLIESADVSIHWSLIAITSTWAICMTCGKTHYFRRSNMEDASVLWISSINVLG
jgi:hypothetical protein